MRIINYKKIPGDKIIEQGELLEKKEPIISIITPYYNANEDVFLTKNSILSQTFPFYEWIIVDDGSTDKESLKILKELQKCDNRIKVFHKENGGPSQARDFAVNQTSKSTKYLFFLDSDDIIDTTMLEILYWSLETHKEASFAYSSLINFGDEEYVSDPFLDIAREKKDNNIYIASMVKKTDFLEVGGFGIKEKKMFEDWGLWLKLLSHNKIPIKISTPLFWYRKSSTGELSRALQNNEQAMSYINSLVDKVDDNAKVIHFPNSGEITPYIDNHIDFTIPLYKKDKKKTILFIIPWMQMGGADIFNLNILKGLDKNKYNPIIITTRVAENEIRNQFLNLCDKIYELASFLERKDFYIFIDYIIRSRNVEIVFTSNSAEGYGILPKIKESYPNIKTIDYIHAIEMNDGKGGFGKYSELFDKYIDFTYTCNNFTREQLINHFHKKSVKTLYIGADTERFDPKKFDSQALKDKYNLPKDKKIITFIARLSGEKEPIHFIKIAQQLIKKREDLFFLMVGDGPLKNDVIKSIKKYKLGTKVKLCDFSNNPEEIYSISDITVNCSSLEGLALTSYESLSMGKPVVSSDVGGQSELIDDSVGKIIKDSNSLKEEEKIKAFANGIEEILNNYNTISKNCRNIIISKFSLKNLINNFNKELNQKNKEVKELPHSKTIFELVLGEEYNLHNWLTNEYYKKMYGIDINEYKIEKSYNYQDFSKLKKIKIWCKKVGIKDEIIYILDFLRTLKYLIVNCIIINLINYIKSIFYHIKYLIKFFIKSIISMPKIIYKTILFFKNNH